MATELTKEFTCKIEERISKKGKPYNVLMVKVAGVWKDVCFVSNELEFDLYKAGVKLVR